MVKQSFTPHSVPVMGRAGDANNNNSQSFHIQLPGLILTLRDRDVPGKADFIAVMVVFLEYGIHDKRFEAFMMFHVKCCTEMLLHCTCVFSKLKRWLEPNLQDIWYREQEAILS